MELNRTRILSVLDVLASSLALIFPQLHFAALFGLTTAIREKRIPARAEWTEVRSYACMRLETFGERVCFT
jgi:hypothetical protein